MVFPKKLQEAIDVARDSLGKTGKGFTLAAVGVRCDGATVVSVNGWNTDVAPMHHAESRAARKLDVGSVLYVARVKKDGSVGMSKPCASCQTILESKGVKAVHFTIDDDAWGTIDLRSSTERMRSWR